MNLPSNAHDDRSSHNPVLREDQTYLTVDGEAWDVSNLLNSLPCNSDDDDDDDDINVNNNNNYCLDNKKVTPSYHQEEPRKLPASLKKNTTHNDNLTLKPVPKYDWRSEQRRANTPSPVPREQQQDDARYYNNNNYDQDEFYYEDDRGELVQASADGGGGANSSLHQSDLMGHDSSNAGNSHNHNGGDTFERSLIEVFPGVEMALRGSVETQDAITRNFIATANCMDCTLQLQCIKDAEYILCPLCHCVSPMELSCTSSVMQGSFGVGLGFCDEEL